MNAQKIQQVHDKGHNILKKYLKHVLYEHA